jgi:hypothetical protein
VLVVLVIVFISLFCWYYYYYQSNENEDVFTAKERLSVANEAAYDWNASTKLISVSQASSDLHMHGLNDWWVYRYATESLGNNSYRYFDITLSINSTIGQYDSWFENESMVLSNRAIVNWDLDSDEILDIALSNNTIMKEITDDYFPPLLWLDNNGSFNENAIWNIVWYHEHDNLDLIRVQFDACTGMVLRIIDYKP